MRTSLWTASQSNDLRWSICRKPTHVHMYKHKHIHMCSHMYTYTRTCRTTCVGAPVSKESRAVKPTTWLRVYLLLCNKDTGLENRHRGCASSLSGEAPSPVYAGWAAKRTCRAHTSESTEEGLRQQAQGLRVLFERRAAVAGSSTCGGRPSRPV